MNQQLEKSIKETKLLLDNYDEKIRGVYGLLEKHDFLDSLALDWFQNQLWISSVIVRKQIEICEIKKDPAYFAQQVILAFPSLFCGLLNEFTRFDGSIEKEYALLDETGKAINVSLKIDDRFRDFVKRVLEKSSASFCFGSEATEISKGSTTSIKQDSAAFVNSQFTETDEASEKKYYNEALIALKRNKIRETIYQSLIRLLNYEIKEKSLTNPVYFVNSYNEGEYLEEYLYTFLENLKQILNSCKNKKAHDTLSDFFSAYFAFKMELFKKKSEFGTDEGILFAYAKSFDNILSRKEKDYISNLKTKLENFKKRYIEIIKELLKHLESLSTNSADSRLITSFCQITYPVALKEIISKK